MGSGSEPVELETEEAVHLAMLPRPATATQMV